MAKIINAVNTYIDSPYYILVIDWMFICIGLVASWVTCYRLHVYLLPNFQLS